VYLEAQPCVKASILRCFARGDGDRAQRQREVSPGSVELGCGEALGFLFGLAERPEIKLYYFLVREQILRNTCIGIFSLVEYIRAVGNL